MISIAGMPKNRWINGAVFGRPALLAVMIALAFMFCATAKADAQTRTLNLYNIHTKENAQITFKRGNRYDQDGLNQLNRFLRDWRQNEPTKMDPLLMDLLWEVYQQAGGRQPIHVVSAYRSPKTNGMLRSRSSGVADNSQHTRGKAIDFYIPGVKLSTLRAAGLRMEGGGVGYYPTSGAPFVHLDTGNVRHWPRMRRNDLMAVFPNGGTIHVPSDGKPLPGYQQAMAAYKSRQGSGTFAVASAGGGSGGGSGGGGGLLASIFRGGSGNSNAPVQESAPAVAQARSAPTPQAPVAAPAAQAPETIIAALPARSVPVPLAAPRPQADVGAPPPAAPTVATALMADGFDASAAAVQAEAMTATEVALNVPLPTRRPDYTPTPAAEAESLVASIKTPETGVPVAALLAERPSRSGSDAISQLLTEDANSARAGVVVNETQTASAAVGDGTTAGEIFALAALPERPASSPIKLDVAPLGHRPDAQETANAIKQRQVAALESSPRAALIARTEGVSPMMAIESGVRTTAKLGKPTVTDTRQARRSLNVDATPEVARWALEPSRVEQISNGTTAPSFAYNIVRTPPAVIYNEGFQQASAQPDTNRFSGKAVQFMSVARFN
ncbi:DUF882 domain-containing protein [Aliihoeflea sp. PC F10.4]